MDALKRRRAHVTLEIHPAPRATTIPFQEIAPRRAVVRCAVNDHHAPWRHVLVPIQEEPPTETGNR